MPGVLLTLLFAAGAAFLGRAWLRRAYDGLDPALQLGLGGLLGLGAVGLATFFLGLVPGALRLSWLVLIALAGGGAFAAYASRAQLAEVRPTLPKGLLALAPAALALGALMALVSVLAPSDASDWDSLAYHLAVPKLWIEAGRIVPVPAIHHSNFPFLVDNLYVWGLQWGGQSGAKAFQLAYLLLGCLTLFGMARQLYGATAGWLAALAFAFVPAVLWESGTAYIDLAHGLYAGLGIVFAGLVLKGERRYWLLSALLLGCAVASKYTGLQTVFAVGLCMLIGGAETRQAGTGLKFGLAIGVLAVILGSPWYVRNAVQMQNPVYPFFYERLGGADWDQRRADIYRNEQQSFGVGRSESGRDPLAMGHAILGLAYQPGRYVNPAQHLGLGSPLGALGFGTIALLLLLMIAGRLGRVEGFCVATVLIGAAMWFFLSQQSRYIATWAVPMAVVAGSLLPRRPFGALAVVSVGVQAVVTLFLMSQLRTSAQLPVVLGTVPADTYQQRTIPFYEAASAINRALGEQEGAKVALYDEVFGYLLDVPYMWANPGHSTRIPYDAMASEQDYVDAMRRLGFSHVYLSMSPMVKDPAWAQRWVAAMGIQGPAQPIPEEERAAILGNWERKWELLVADAAREGLLRPVQGFRSGILFEIVPGASR